MFRAVLHTLLLLHRAWPLLGAFLLAPRLIADPVYDYIGRHLYRWLGQVDACWMPESDQRWRFLDADETLGKFT